MRRAQWKDVSEKDTRNSFLLDKDILWAVTRCDNLVTVLVSFILSDNEKKRDLIF